MHDCRTRHARQAAYRIKGPLFKVLGNLLYRGYDMPMGTAVWRLIWIDLHISHVKL